jgi:hypothetical protein
MKKHKIHKITANQSRHTSNADMQISLSLEMFLFINMVLSSCLPWIVWVHLTSMLMEMMEIMFALDQLWWKC